MNNMFDNCNFIYCINHYINQDISNQLINFRLNCSDICFISENHKFYLEEYICVNNCYTMNLYEKKNNICYPIPVGYYLNDTSLYKCDIKCYNCTLESVQNNSCISCNNLQNYYPKLLEYSNSNLFVNYNECNNSIFIIRFPFNIYIKKSKV